MSCHVRVCRAGSALGFLALMVFAAMPCSALAADLPKQSLARQILEETGIRGGLIVHLGCRDGTLTAALCPGESYRVHGLDADPANVDAAREHVRALGLCGRVSVEPWSGQDLPYVDNLVNLVVAEKASGVPADEILRVLAPGGVAYVRSGDRWVKTVKPRPTGIDEWTHYLHDATNNAVARDTVVGPPRHYQWIGTPEYLRHHDHMSGLSAMVASGGRLFYILDLGPRWSVEMPPEWALVARDAFNGVILWQRPIPKWHPHLWPLKRGPAQLMRRLVAEGDVVYVTLGVGEPVTALDAATGKIVRAFEGTEGAEEIILSDGVLHMVVNPELDAYKAISLESVETVRSAGRDWNWDEGPRRLVAIEAASGKTLWSRVARVAPSTLAAAAGRVYLHDGEKVVCLASPSGREIWSSPPVPRWKPMHVLFSPTLVVHDDVVLFAGGENMDPLRGGQDSMTALSAETGKVLWTAPHPPSGYASAEDLFVADGLVWCGVTSSPRDSGVFTGRDPHTGEVRREFPPDDWPHMPHHRCHRAKATCNYILTSRTGIEFVDLRNERWTAHHWVRGSCNYGILPCNGLLYAPPHSCACYLLAKLSGLNALAPERRDEERGARGEGDSDAEAGRLERGPAYGASIDHQSTIIDHRSDWPTYRGNAERSGSTKSVVPTADLACLWQADLGGKLTSAVVAGGRAFVASVDAHEVYAFDADSGKPLWSFTAGGRVDSPPTVWQDLVLFGSHDGCVYCLRASDGRLAWRFRAAPQTRRMVAREQVESVWPVPGSVLVHEGVAYCVAGRAMWLDGGLRLVRLDARSGRLLSETVLDDKYPGTQDNLQKDLQWPNLPVALPDVLSCDGRHVYMRSQPFDLEGKRTEVITPRRYDEQRGETAHLFSPTGFLDDSWWHRTYWLYGRSFISAAGGWYLAAYQAPAGKILVMDETSVYGFGNAPLRFVGTPNTYHLFACGKEPEIINPNPKQEPRRRGTRIYGRVVATRLGYRWSQSAPLLARAMVLAGDALWVAGPPLMADELDVYQRYGDPDVQAKAAEHVAAFEGRQGGLLMAASKDDGKRLAAYRLDAPPVFDGMVAAGGRLLLSTMDGKLLCLASGSGQPLEPASEAEFGPAPEGSLAAARAAARRIVPTVSHPDFHELEAVRITTSDLGYRIATSPGSVGRAVKKLAAPLTKRAHFSLEIRTTPGAPSPDTPGNGFLAFGDAPDEDKLVKCGYRISGKVALITQGPMEKSRSTSRRADLKANEVTQLDVAVDLVAQKVTVTAGGQTVEASLERHLDAITWVGYCVHSVAADFSPIETSGE